MRATRKRRLARAGAVTVVAALGVTTALTATSAAFADTGTWLVGGSSGATVSVANAVISGDAIHLEGTGWTDGTDDSAADGSWIAVKLGAAGGVEDGILTTEPAAGRFTFPGASAGTASVWSGIVADDTGAFTADIPFPTGSNTAPALATAWTAGTTHHLQLLTGSLKQGGDQPRSVYVTFTVSGDSITVSAGSGGRGAAPGSTTVTVAGAAGTFAANEALTATVDGVATAWTAGGTASATGALASTTIVYPAGGIRAGAHTLTLTGATSGTKTRTFTVSPTAAYSSLTQGSTGTLTLSNLPTGSAVTGASFDGSGIAFTGLGVVADANGTAVVGYTIPASQALGTYPVTVTLSNPAATYTLAGQKISPDAATFGDGQFQLSSNGTGIFQGLYQSAYSTSRNALYATAASGTGAAEDGYLYKLDPNTLQVLVSAHPKELTVGGETGKAPYGVGVDDVNGNVWVTNTRTATVAVYDADDLTLLKQFPANLITHPRDVVYDAATDKVFASSASEGTSGNGYITVFDAKSLEKITDIQTGARTDFNPVSLTLGGGFLYSPSLSSNKIAKIDTATNAVQFLTITGINVGGRGASGIAYDAADDRLFIASQNSDEVVIADAATGATIAEVATGAGALNVSYDAVHKLAYVTNFGGSTVTVLDNDGNKIANLPIARANHVTLDGAGNAYVVDKNTGNKVWKISYLGAPVVVGGTASVDVLVDIPTGGGLTLSVAGSSADLGVAALDPSATSYVAGGALPTVTVADVRSAQPGWNLVGKVSEFTSDAGTFSGDSLGWAPKVLSSGAGQTVAAGSAKASGLSSGAALATSPAGASRGTATIGADLTLKAPTSVAPGAYAAVLTLTLS